MALQVRSIGADIMFALVTAYNLQKREFTANETTYPHCDITSTPGGNYRAPTSSPYICVSATATDLPTVITRLNEAKAVMNVHLVDAVGHKAADAVIATADASDQATANTLANAIKAKFNTHGASATFHFTADGTNVIAAADATDLASSVTLANEIFTDLNAHIQFGPTAPSIQLIPA